MNRTSINLLSGIILISFYFIFSAELVYAQDMDCSDCHEALPKTSAHFDVVECSDCHSDIKDMDHADAKVKKVDCTLCHDEYAKTVERDIHHRLKGKVKNPPTCITCHGTHDIISPSKVKNKVKQYCTSCHTNVLLANPYHSIALKDNVCAECHDTEDHSEQLVLSVHKELMCADCHNYISHNLREHPENVDPLQKADCYLCHSSIASEHRESIHGISLLEGVDEAADCWDCHGSHEIVKVKDEKSKVNVKNLPYTCGRCHSNPEVIEKFDISVNCPTMMYTSSVHGKVNADGGSGATCSSCHGVHDIKNRVQPGSKISTFNIPSTCEKCHAQIAQEYTESIHWIRVKQGVRVSPVCTDCHCEHGINAINSAEFKKDEIKRIQEETCFRCHENPILAKKFETNVGNLKRYQDSYHGLAVIRGDEDAAMCVDCHGVHKILPKRHPESEVNEANVTNTCQKCHPEANEIFSKSYSHISQSEEAIVIESWVEIIYVWLIIVVIGGMVLHNLLIFVHSLKQKRRKEKGQVSIPRLTRNEVIQHILLLTSFILLVITGFALKYPEAGWAKGLTWLGMSEPIRQLIHKSSAVLMLALSFYHIFYLAFTKRGRNSFMELIPTFEDVTAAIHNVLYYLGLRKEKPEFTDYDYAEKAEYWALIWGTIVMGITGLVLWFPTVVGEWAPIWFIKVSEIIHFYEAILASLAIVVWHLFFVIFRPGEYPMSLTWIDGKMSLKHYKHHHEKQFIKISEEILRYDKAELKKEEMSYHANLFYDTIESNGHDPVQSILDVIESNEKLLKHFKLNP